MSLTKVLIDLVDVELSLKVVLGKLRFNVENVESDRELTEFGRQYEASRISASFYHAADLGNSGSTSVCEVAQSIEMMVSVLPQPLKKHFKQGQSDYFA